MGPSSTSGYFIEDRWILHSENGFVCNSSEMVYFTWPYCKLCLCFCSFTMTYLHMSQQEFILEIRFGNKQVIKST
jgi:hypothetical protein